MDRERLLHLDKDVLVDLIIQLQAAVVPLAARISVLETELAARRQPPKTPTNSSVPPSQGQKANRAERHGRARGARRGHLGSSRRRQTPDTVVKVRPAACGGCGAALSPRDQRRVGKKSGGRGATGPPRGD